MSEFMRSGSESLEDERQFNPDITNLAADSLSRAVGNQNKENDSRNYDEEADYDSSSDNEGYEDGYDDDDYGYEDDYDDDFFDDYEEVYRGERRTEFSDEKLTTQEIPVPEKILERCSFLGELPHGVAVVGGVARSIAREIITGESEPIRDIDLINIVDENGNSEVDADTLHKLSREYMPDDYAFGHGIGNDTLSHYFRTRDFTINQSLIMGGKLIISNFAYNDFQENIIRPTYFEHPYEGDEVRSRIFLKAIMMRSVLSLISDSIPLIEDIKQPRPSSIGSFDIALFLNKAMSRGAETARLFTSDLADWGVVSGEYSGRPVKLAKAVLKDVYAFDFRPSTDKRFRDIKECDDMNGYFAPPAMSQYHASDPIIRRAMAEYEDESGAPINIGEDRLSGHYTEAEYEDINRSFTRRSHEDYFRD